MLNMKKLIALRIVCALILLLNLSQVWADRHRPTKILVLGDSLSAAYKMVESAGWVYRLKQRLTSEDYTLTIDNASVSGATTAAGKQLLPGALERFKPDLVILELGANDGLQGKPITYISTNLGDLIATSQQAEADVLLLGVRLPPNRGKRYTEPFFQQYKQLSSQYRTGLVPFFLEGVAGNRALMMEDGLHPNAEGQKVIADLIYPYLKSYLDSGHFSLQK